MSSWFPPPSRPRAVQGGIKARSARGEIAQTWWSKRFVDHLDSLGVAARLARGKSYARRGQVIAMHMEPGAVSASVQGSRSRPYRVRVGLPTFGKGEWARVVDRLAGDAWFSAKLLAGEMPSDIEDLFAAEGLSLFPRDARELAMDCSCPDWEVPCKHIAAVFYLLAEAFDADPFMVLAWRGRERDDLLDAISSLRTGAVPGDRAEGTGEAVPLSSCLDRFFDYAAEPPRQTATDGIPTATAPDALLDQLPAVSVKIRGAELTEVLRPVYQALGRLA